MADNQIDELPELPDIMTIIGKPEHKTSRVFLVIFGE
jgi:hypothetical protein